MEFSWTGTKGALKWKARFNIALGIAEGLLYLHEGCHRRIIHRDIKASNILLTEDYQPQVCILLPVSCRSPICYMIPRVLLNATVFIPSLHRSQILDLQSGFLTNGLIMLCSPLKGHSGEFDKFFSVSSQWFNRTQKKKQCHCWF